MTNFFNLLLFRMIWLAIGVAILSLTYPVTSRFSPYKQKQAVLEISSFNPGEHITISKMEWWSEHEATADDKGVVTFLDIPLGNWMIVKGGSEELRKLIIPIREYPPELKVGSIRVTYRETNRPRYIDKE